MSDNLIKNKRDHHHVRGNAGPIIVIIVIIAVVAGVATMFFARSSSITIQSTSNSVVVDEVSESNTPAIDDKTKDINTPQDKKSE